MHYIVAILIIIIDQITKYMIVANMALFESIPIIENIFHLTYIQNRGMAFGMMQNQKIFFVIITALILGVILTYYYRNKHEISPFFRYSLFIVAGGATGNFIDRMRLSYVVDFFDFRIWPVFNVADIAVVIGTIMLAVYIFFIEPKEKKEKDKTIGNI